MESQTKDKKVKSKNETSWYFNKFWDFIFDGPDKPKKKTETTRSIDEIAPMTKREVLLRFANPWRAIMFFCLPTVALMLVQGLYNIVDKTLALEFATPHAVQNWDYISAMLQKGGIVEQYYNLHDAEATATFAHYFIDINNGAGLEAFKSLINADWVMDGNITLALQNGIHISDATMESYINLTTQYTTQGYTLTFAFNQAIAIGTGMVFAVEFGRGGREKLKEISGNGFSFALIGSIIIAMLLFLLSFPGVGQPLISSQMGSNVNPVIEMLAWNDIWPLIYFLPILFLANYLMSLLRSEGKVMHVMIMVITSLGVKCGIAILLMSQTSLELAGTQLGTIAAFAYQLVYAAIIVFFSKNSYSKFSWNHMVDLKKDNFIGTVKAGIPNFVLYFAIFINAYVSTSLVGHLPPLMPEAGGDGTSMEQKLLSAMGPWSNFIVSAVIGLNQGVRTIIAFNYGAQNNRRIVDITKRSSWLMLAWFVFILVLIISVGPTMLTMFAFPAEYGYYGSPYYWAQIVYYMTYPLACLTYIGLGLFQGTNKSIAASIVTSFRSITIFVPMTLIGYGIAMASGNAFWYFFFIGLTDLIAAFFILPIIYAYYMRSKKRNRLLSTQEIPWYVQLSYDKYLELEKNKQVNNNKK